MIKGDKFYIFDMDGTLTESRCKMSNRMIEVLKNLCSKYPLIVISGATLEQMEKQIPFYGISWASANSFIIKMGQNGNIAKRSLQYLFKNTLTVYEKMKIYSHINKVMTKFSYKVKEDSDLVEDRGCQISYSLLGHNTPREDKSKFDPGGTLRANILHHVPLEEEELTVKIGGTTCLDYIRKDGTKAANLQRLLTPEQLSNSVYIGDQLYPGGNDSDVKTISGLRCIPVKNPQETYNFIKKELSI